MKYQFPCSCEYKFKTYFRENISKIYCMQYPLFVICIIIYSHESRTVIQCYVQYKTTIFHTRTTVYLHTHRYTLKLMTTSQNIAILYT